jgi:hypothetical protein
MIDECTELEEWVYRTAWERPDAMALFNYKSHTD